MNNQMKITIDGNTERLWKMFKNAVGDLDLDSLDFLKAHELDRDICESWLRGVGGRLASHWSDCEIHVVHHGKPWWARKGAYWVAENLATKENQDTVDDIMAGTWNQLVELCVNLQNYGPEIIRAAVKELN